MASSSATSSPLESPPEPRAADAVGGAPSEMCRNSLVLHAGSAPGSMKWGSAGPAALRNGLSEDEIAEILLQVAIYGGVPAANEAFRAAQRALGSDSHERESEG